MSLPGSGCSLWHERPGVNSTRSRLARPNRELDPHIHQGHYRLNVQLDLIKHFVVTKLN